VPFRGLRSEEKSGRHLLSRAFQPSPEADVLSFTVRNDSLRATAISVGFVGVDSPRVDIDSDSLCVDIASDALRVDIDSAADLPRWDNTRFRAAHILLSHAGHSQEWRDGAMTRMYLIVMIFPPAFTRKYHWQVTGLVALIFIKEARDCLVFRLRRNRLTCCPGESRIALQRLNRL
jgi:hypothetical protein